MTNLTKAERGEAMWLADNSMAFPRWRETMQRYEEALAEAEARLEAIRAGIENHCVICRDGGRNIPTCCLCSLKGIIRLVEVSGECGEGA